jgi:hypothetical protein
MSTNIGPINLLGLLTLSWSNRRQNNIVSIPYGSEINEVNGSELTTYQLTGPIFNGVIHPKYLRQQLVELFNNPSREFTYIDFGGQSEIVGNWELNKDLAFPITNIPALGIFSNTLYGGTGFQGRFLKYGGGTSWSEIHDFTEQVAVSIVEYNNKMYVGTLNSGNVYEYDGVSWSLSYTSSELAINALAVYGGDLYAGSGDFSGTNGTVYKFNGTTWSTSFASGQLSIQALTVYNGKLYAGSGSLGKIFEYNGTTWSESFDSTETTIYSLKEYNSNLYAGTSPNGKVLVYNGTAWSENFDSGENDIFSFAVYENNLYAGSGTNGKIFKYDGSAWALDFSTGESDVFSLAIFEGGLFAGTGSNGKIFYIPPLITEGETGWYLLDTLSTEIVPNTFHYSFSATIKRLQSQPVALFAEDDVPLLSDYSLSERRWVAMPNGEGDSSHALRTGENGSTRIVVNSSTFYMPYNQTANIPDFRCQVYDTTVRGSLRDFLSNPTTEDTWVERFGLGNSYEGDVVISNGLIRLVYTRSNNTFPASTGVGRYDIHIWNGAAWEWACFDFLPLFTTAIAYGPPHISKLTDNKIEFTQWFSDRQKTFYAVTNVLSYGSYYISKELVTRKGSLSSLSPLSSETHTIIGTVHSVVSDNYSSIQFQTSTGFNFNMGFLHTKTPSPSTSGHTLYLGYSAPVNRRFQVGVFVLPNPPESGTTLGNIGREYLSGSQQERVLVNPVWL